jgi:hypothetical protein
VNGIRESEHGRHLGIRRRTVFGNPYNGIRDPEHKYLVLYLSFRLQEVVLSAARLGEPTDQENR